MASIIFYNVYAVDTSQSPAAKEQSGLFFFATGYGQAEISDGSSGLNFSGNDVSAVGLHLIDPSTGDEHTYYGWISRPIKSGGQVKGFYFWSDLNFTTLA